MRKSVIVLLVLVLAGSVFAATVSADTGANWMSNTVGSVNCVASNSVTATGSTGGSCSASSTAGSAITQISVSAYCNEYHWGSYIRQVFSGSATRSSSSVISVSGSFSTTYGYTYQLYSTHYYNVNGNTWTCSNLGSTAYA